MKMERTVLLSSPGDCGCVGRIAGLSPASNWPHRIGHVDERGDDAGVYMEVVRRSGRRAMRTIVIGSDGSATVYDESGQSIETYPPGSLALPNGAPGGLFESHDQCIERENVCAEAWPY